MHLKNNGLLTFSRLIKSLTLSLIFLSIFPYKLSLAFNSINQDNKLIRENALLKADYKKNDKHQVKFQIHEILIEGEGIESLKPILKPIINSLVKNKLLCVGKEEINLIISTLQNEIIKHGFITSRILIGPQNLSNGKLILHILPGKIKKINFQTNLPACHHLEKGIPNSELLNIRIIEQGLENLRRLPSISADFKIIPSAFYSSYANYSDLVITYHQERFSRIKIILNDSGAHETGRLMANSTISFDNLFMLSDLLTFNYSQSLHPKKKHVGGLNAHFSAPYKNWIISLNSSFNEFYQFIANFQDGIIYSGDNKQYDVTFSRRLYRDHNYKSSMDVSFFYTRSTSFINNEELYTQQGQFYGWFINFLNKWNFADEEIELAIGYRKILSCVTLFYPEAPHLNKNASLINGSINFTHPFIINHYRYQLNTHIRGQFSTRPVFPSDFINMGGRSSVRGFDGNQVLAGSKGIVIQNELLTPINEYHSLYISLDYGKIFSKGESLLKGTHILGTSLGTKGHLHRVNYHLFVGVPLSKPKTLLTNNIVSGFELSIDM